MLGDSGNEDWGPIEKWIISVHCIPTKMLRMDEIEFLEKEFTESSVERESSTNLKADTQISQPIGESLQSLFETEFHDENDDDYENAWSIRKSNGNLSAALIEGDEEVPKDDDELPILNTMLPEDAGIAYHSYANPHLEINKVLLPRKIFHREIKEANSEIESENYFGVPNELGWFCPNINCVVCEEHELLLRTKNVSFPKEYCQFLLEVNSICETETQGVKNFRCQFCNSSRLIPLEKFRYHLERAHGIIDKNEDIELLAHPELVFEQLTSIGYYTSCLCGMCNKWYRLSPDQQTKYGGLFEPFFNHLKICEANNSNND